MMFGCKHMYVALNAKIIMNNDVTVIQALVISITNL
jgi:hypothetical protein